MPIELYDRAGIWYLRGTFQGVKVHKSAGTRDKAVAQGVRTATEKEILQARLDPEGAERAKQRERTRVSFADAVDHYLKHGNRAPYTAKTVYYLDRLKAHLGAVSIGDIDQATVDGAIEAMVGLDAAPDTKRRTVTTPLVAVLTHMSKRTGLRVPVFDLPKQRKANIPFIAPRQALALIQAAPAHLKPLLVFQFGTGARLSEALGLDWVDVDLARASVLLRDTKNGEDREAALPPAVVAALASTTQADQRTGRVFRRDDGSNWPERTGQDAGAYEFDYDAWRRLSEAAGLMVAAVDGQGAAALDEAGNPVMVPLFTPHAMRHSWATWFYALSRNLLLLKTEGGWKDDRMVMRYTKLMNSAHEPDVALVWGGAHPRMAATVQTREAARG